MMKILLLIVMMVMLILLILNYKGLYLSLMLFLIYMYLYMSMNFNNYWMLIYSGLGIDNIANILIMLMMWIFSLSFLVNLNSSFNNMYVYLLILLLMILLLSFMWINMFMFYFFFEFSLIPIFLIIVGWGYQVERLKASYYMLFYTFFFSLPFMLILFYLYMYMNSMNLLLFKELLMSEFWSLMFYMLMFSAFMVKLPVFFFHNWLSKAHVEAPVVGSMILAAIMLKLGGYGIYRFMLVLNLNFLWMNDLIMIFSIFGMMILSFLCLRQLDIKVIIAYSSVVHMGMMLIGMLMMKEWSMGGAILMLVGHGLCSSSLFMMLNLIYVRSGSRSLLINKGMIYFMPSLMIFWFLLCMNNMSSPLSLNLISEVMIISLILNWSIKLMILIMLGMFMSACYSLYLFSFVYHGIYNMKLFKMFNINMLEFILLISHFVPLNLLLLKLNYTLML